MAYTRAGVASPNSSSDSSAGGRGPGASDAISHTSASVSSSAPCASAAAAKRSTSAAAYAAPPGTVNVTWEGAMEKRPVDDTTQNFFLPSGSLTWPSARRPSRLNSTSVLSARPASPPLAAGAAAATSAAPRRAPPVPPRLPPAPALPPAGLVVASQAAAPPPRGPSAPAAVGGARAATAARWPALALAGGRRGARGARGAPGAIAAPPPPEAAGGLSPGTRRLGHSPEAHRRFSSMTVSSARTTTRVRNVSPSARASSRAMLANTRPPRGGEVPRRAPALARRHTVGLAPYNWNASAAARIQAEVAANSALGSEDPALLFLRARRARESRRVRLREEGESDLVAAVSRASAVYKRLSGGGAPDGPLLLTPAPAPAAPQLALTM